MISSIGVELIAKERRRQVYFEGWTQTHDDTHDRAELAKAAVTYALYACEQVTVELLELLEQGGPVTYQGHPWMVKY